MKKIPYLIIVGLFAVVTTTKASSIGLNFNPGGSGSVTGTEIVGLNGVQAGDWVDLDASATAVDIDGVAGSATIDYVSAYNFNATPTQDSTQNSYMMKRAIRVGGTGDETLSQSEGEAGAKAGADCAVRMVLIVQVGKGDVWCHKDHLLTGAENFC